MQRVSTQWLTNQRQIITSESDLEIVFDNVWDDTLPSNAILTDNGSAPHGVTTVIESNRKTIPPKYVTFEQNQWLLDGLGVVLPSAGGADTGFISEALGDPEGKFTSPPEVSVKLPSMGGLRLGDVIIEWDKAFGDHAITFELVGYLHAEVVFTQLVAWNTSPTSTVSVGVACDALVVRILKWSLPYRRARLDGLTVEHALTFDKHSIMNFEHFQEADPLSARLPKAGVRFSINNTDERFNPYNPDSTLYSQLIERTPIEVRYGFVLGGETETISGGKYYLSGWTAPQNGLSAEFEAVDNLGLLREITYTKGKYHPLGKSLADLAHDVLGEASLHYGWTYINWSIDPALDDITTVAPLPVTSHAECLQMIANAGKCSLYCDREGRITLKRFTPPSMNGYKQSGSFVSGATFSLPLGVSPQTYPIDSLVSYRRPELRITRPIKGVDVSRFYYQVESPLVELYRATVPVVDLAWITLNVTYPPSTEVVATVTGDGSLDLAGTNFYANGCVLVINATGDFEVVVEGKKLIVTEIIEPVGTPIGEHQAIKNPMITHVSNALEVGDWALNFLTNRSIVSFDWRADPRLEANDIITMNTKYGSSHVMMHDFTMSYNGVFRGKGEGRDVGALGNARF